MAIITEESLNAGIVKEVAGRILLAARTAPKARGVDNLRLAIVDGNDIRILADKMIEIGERFEVEFFKRDAQNILNSPVVLLFGTVIRSQGLKKCGMCGYENCEERERHPKTPCVFNTGDLGIAIGSAVSIAADNRVDSRVMYSIGQAAMELEMLGKDVAVAYGIPLSAMAKSPFFDRK
ncbi:MAG: DUF2148 domain-containing protein [Bacteroidota bacterium]